MDGNLDSRALTYSEVGATAVAEDAWSVAPAGFRRFERTVSVNAPWDETRALMLQWAVKTRSRFTVDADAVRAGANVWLRLAIDR